MFKTETTKWFVVQIKPNSYALASRNLERQGLKTFIPKMRVTNKINNKFVTKETYVFPGYVFVSFNPFLYQWQKINSTYGVSKVLTFNKGPEEISTEIINLIKSRFNMEEIKSQNDELNKGDLIKIYTGPFADFFAKIESVDKNNRIWLLLEYEGKIRKLKYNKNRHTKIRKL